MKRNPLISPPGCLTALVFIAGMVMVTQLFGGVMFSPGALSTQGSSRPPLKNYASHAEYEGHCEWCHVPWQGSSATLCEECHTNVADELRTGTGLHGVLKSGGDCQLCHIEHKGPDADQTALAMLTFPHEQTGYSLVKHQTWPDGRSFACRDCHDPVAPGYTFETSLCETCHRQLDAGFVDRHVARFSSNCLVCHRQLEPFDHHTFPLSGGHANVPCAKCHAPNDFSQAKAECVACHQDPEIHAGLFGTDCAACHTIEAWSGARLAKHDFPIGHGGEGDIACTTCHTQSYSTYTCYNCHEHSDVAEIRDTHVQAGIPEFSDCMKCHADGKTHKE